MNLKLLSLILFFSVGSNAFGKSSGNPISFPAFQLDTVPVIDSAEFKIFEKVEVAASFLGGDESWRRFLERNLNGTTPVDNGAKAGLYTVVIQFIVDKEGNISDIKPLTRHGHGMEAEVMRVIAKAPKWKPAMKNGRPVKAYRKQPVTFQVVEEVKKRRKNN